MPATYRGALASDAYQGIIAYPSLTDPAIHAFGRDMLERMNRERFSRSMEDGAFEDMLLGGSDGSVVETVMALARELPFDGEGRVVLPASLTEHAGVTERAVFVGRGAYFQIWTPENFEKRQADDIARVRARLANESGAR